MRCKKCLKPTRYNVCLDCATHEEKEALDNLEKLDQLIHDRQQEIKRLKKLKWNMPTKLIVGIIIGTIGLGIVYGYNDMTTALGAVLVLIGLFVGFAGWMESFPTNMANADTIDELVYSVRDLNDERREIINKHWRNKHV
jgi:tetrahydromethanopterin S-methyltransferase subunit F